MAYIYGSPAHGDTVTAGARRKDILLRIALPLLFLFIMASAGLHAFLHGSYIITAFFVAFFVFLLLRFEELGLTLALRLSGAGTAARADRIVAKTLHLLPEGYHVFHGLKSGGAHIDHAVVGPNGFFVISTRTNLGEITAVRESLRLNGWPFLGDPVGRCWKRSLALLRDLDLHHSGAIQVCPVLCFSRGSVATERLVRGVMIAQASDLVRMILEHESPLPSEKLLQLTDRLAPLVLVKADEAVATHLGTQAEDGGHARRPVCSKCLHMPSELEAELFPGECPRCGRLYSAIHEDGLDAPGPAATGTTASSLATACLIVCAGSVLLAYQAGLFDPDRTASASIPSNASGEAPHGLAAVQAAPEQAVPEQATPQALPAQAEPVQTKSVQAVPGPSAKTPETAAAVTPPNPEPGRPDPMPGQSPEQGRTAPPAATAESTGAPAQGGLQAQDRAAACASPAAAETATAAAPPDGPKEPRSPVGLSTEGTLTIVTTNPVTLWLTNDQTLKRFGPYETRPRKELDIILPKGCYSLVLVENGRRRKTTVSFLSDAGRLEF